MRSKIVALAATLALAPAAALAQASVTHVPMPPRPGGGPPPPFSAAVVAGETVYLSGITDGGTALGGSTADAAKRVLDGLKRNAEAAGVSMDDLAWVQVFSSDLGDYQTFNEVYRTYFKGPMPARAYIGTDKLLGGARFEVMGVAVKRQR
ncbi:MAG: Rid family hydrolase [Pseudomonadota bacterium]